MGNKAKGTSDLRDLAGFFPAPLSYTPVEKRVFRDRKSVVDSTSGARSFM